MKSNDFLQLFEKPVSAMEAQAVLRDLGLHDAWYARKMAIDTYGFAVPCKEAVEALVALSPLIEVGTGNGYYSRLLGASGADIVATDVGKQGGYSKMWKTEGVLQAEAVEAVKAYPDRNVFMSWPSYDESWAGQVAKAMAKGRVLAYIGEGRGGCTADDGFFDILDSDFEEIGGVAIPKWEGIHDYLKLYKKKV